MTRTKKPAHPLQVVFSVKRRNPDNGEWQLVSINDLAGRPLAEMFTVYDGQEVVAEIAIGEERFYFAGTEHWLERMSRKGRAATFSAGLEILRDRRPDLLEEIIPHVDAIAGIFEGVALQRVEYMGTKTDGSQK